MPEWHIGWGTGCLIILPADAMAFFFVGMRRVIIHARGGSEGWSACDFEESYICVSTEWELGRSLIYGARKRTLNQGYCDVDGTTWWELYNNCSMNIGDSNRTKLVEFVFHIIQWHHDKLLRQKQICSNAQWWSWSSRCRLKLAMFRPRDLTTDAGDTLNN